MEESRWFATACLVACLWISANAQQGAVVSSKPGSAVGMRLPSTVSPPAKEHASMTLSCEWGVALMITDPQGRRLGDDPLHHTHYDEIPGGYYEAGGIEDDETGAQEDEPVGFLHLENPATGNYRIDVIAKKAGPYSCEFAGVDAQGNGSRRDLTDIPIEAGHVDTYLLRFKGTPGSKIEVTEKR